MKITATKKEDILRRKAEYDAEMEAYNQDSEARYQRFREAEYALTDPIQRKLESDLAKFDALTFQVSVDFAFGDNPRVRILCNEYNKFDDSVALAWSYDAEISKKTGEVKRETSSWSGMKATTAAQIESLKQSVAALEYLLGVDWESLLNIDRPDWQQFMEGALKRPKQQNFDAELLEAELSELVGTNTLIKVQNWEETNSRWRRDRYIQIERETPAQYVVHYISAYVVEESLNRGATLADVLNDPANGFKYTTRVSKSKIVPVKPFTTLEF